jgi:hypothetical protein
MGGTLRGLLITVIAVTSLISCNEREDSNGGKGGKNAENLTLDLKGFQIIREKHTDGRGKPEIFDNRPFDTVPESLLLSDKIYFSAEEPPSDLRLETTVSCGEDIYVDESDLANVQYQRSTVYKFDRPIEVLELVPEDILFRPHNPSNDGLECHFRLQVFNKYGADYNASNSPDPAMLEAHPGGFKKVFASGPNRLMESLVLSYNRTEVLSESTQIHKADFPELMIWGDRLSYQDVQFNKIKLVCETYELVEEFSGLAKQSSLRDLDFDKAAIKEKYKFTQHDTFVNQTCRLFTYRDSRLVGVSSYFKLVEDQRYPEVSFSYSDQTAYSNGYKNNDQFFMTNFARMVVRNPHDTPILVGIDPSEFSGQAQFISASTLSVTSGSLRGGVYRLTPSGNRFTAYREHRSVIYDMYPKIDLLVSEQLSVSGRLSPRSTRLEETDSEGTQVFTYSGDNKPFYQAILAPGEQMIVNFSFDDGVSKCWFYNKRNIGRNSQVGARGTYGVVLRATAPSVYLNELAPTPVDDFFKEESYRRVGSAGEPIELGNHFLYSTTENNTNWKYVFELPQNRLVIDENPDLGDLDNQHVCREENYFVR